MTQELTNIQEFTSKCRGMSKETLSLVATYLSQMMEADKQNSLRTTHETFSYPLRGGQNDGNPALRAILSLLPNHKMVVSENEYTKARAIWLCEDFNVVWSKKASLTVLPEALQIVNSIQAEHEKKEKQPSTLATAHYKANAQQDPKIGQIMSKKNPDGSKTTILLYEGTEYPNALDWMKGAFNNSGKLVPSVQIFKEPSSIGSTPRPTRYIPPNHNCSFGQYV